MFRVVRRRCLSLLFDLPSWQGQVWSSRMERHLQFRRFRPRCGFQAPRQIRGRPLRRYVDANSCRPAGRKLGVCHRKHHVWWLGDRRVGSTVPAGGSGSLLFSEYFWRCGEFRHVHGLNSGTLNIDRGRAEFNQYCFVSRSEFRRLEHRRPIT